MASNVNCYQSLRLAATPKHSGGAVAKQRSLGQSRHGSRELDDRQSTAAKTASRAAPVSMTGRAEQLAEFHGVVARRAPGGPPKAEPGADAGPAARQAPRLIQ